MKVVVHVDGGSRGNPGPAAGAAVICSADGELLDQASELLGVATNNVAEWTALIEGLEAAIARGVDDLTVRMDSELVVKQLAGVYRVKHPGLIPLHARAKALLRKFAQVDVAHVRRKDNAAADAVVNQILDAAR